MTLCRVEQLFALACSTTSEEEARTAAVAGVRLMKKSGLRVTAEPAPMPPAFDSAAWWWARAATPPPATSGPPPRGAPAKGSWRDPVWIEHWCHGCDARISPGERFYHADDGSFWCGRH